MFKLNTMEVLATGKVKLKMTGETLKVCSDKRKPKMAAIKAIAAIAAMAPMHYAKVVKTRFEVVNLDK